MSFNMHALSEVTSVIHVASREERAAHIGRERLLIYSHKPQGRNSRAPIKADSAEARVFGAKNGWIEGRAGGEKGKLGHRLNGHLQVGIVRLKKDRNTGNNGFWINPRIDVVIELLNIIGYATPYLLYNGASVEPTKGYCQLI